MQTRMIKIKELNNRDRWKKAKKSNSDLWFTLPPQRSLPFSWIFSAIPIPCLRKLFFIIFYASSSNLYFMAWLNYIEYVAIMSLWIMILLHKPFTTAAILKTLHKDIIYVSIQIFGIIRDCNRKHWNKQLRWNTNWVHAF